MRGGHSDHEGAGSLSRCDPGRGILDNSEAGSIQCPGGQQMALRVRFARLHILGPDEHFRGRQPAALCLARISRWLPEVTTAQR